MTNEELIQIIVQMQSAVKDLDTISKKLDGVSKSVDSVDKSTKSVSFDSMVKNAGGALEGIGNSLTRLGTKFMIAGGAWSAAISYPLQQLGKESLQLFLEVETQWGKFVKATGTSIDDLKIKYEEYAMVISNQFAVAQEDVVQTLTDFYKVGIEDEAMLKSLTKTAIETSILFDMELTEATETVSKTMLQWGLNTDEVRIALSKINEIADQTATSEADLAFAFTKASPTAAALGVSIDELGGYLAALAGRGFRAGEAGNGLKTIFQNLSIETERVSNVLDALGVSYDSIDIATLSISDKLKLMSKGYAGLREELGMTDDQMIQLAQTYEENDGQLTNMTESQAKFFNSSSVLFGKWQLPKALAVISDMSNAFDDSADSVSQYEKALQAAGIGLDSLISQWDTKLSQAQQNQAFRWEQINTRIDNAKIIIGDLVSNALLPLSEKLEGVLKWFTDLDPSTQQFIVNLGLILTAIGPIVLMVGALINNLGILASVLGGALSGIGAVGAGPIAIIGAGIAGVIYWIDKLKETFIDNFINKIDVSVFDSIKQAWDALVAGFKEGFGLTQSEDAEQTFIQKIADALTWLAQKINEVDWTQVIEGAKIVGQVLGFVIGVIWDVIKIFGAVLVVVGGVIATVVGTIATFYLWLTGKTDEINQWWTNVWNTIMTTIQTVWDKIWGIIGPTIELIGNVIRLVTGVILLVWQTIWDKVVEIARNVWAKIYQWMVDSGIIAIYNQVRDWVLKIYNTVKDKMNDVGSAFSTAWDNIKNTVKGFIDSAWTWGKDLIQNLINGINNKIGELSATISRVADEVWSQLHFSVPEEGPLKDADKWMPDFISLMVKGIDQNAYKLFNSVAGLASGIQSAINPNMAFNASVSNLGGLQSDIAGQLAIPVNASMAQQNIVQVHEHYEVRPGVMIASDSEQREFVRHVEKLMNMETIRTSYD